MMKAIINEWEPIKDIKNNKLMSNELYLEHKRAISESPPDHARLPMYEIHSCAAYEREGHKSFSEFIKSIHGSYAKAYTDGLLAANAEATVFGEKSIGTIDVAAAIALRQIMHCRTSINKVKRYMADRQLDWSFINTQEAISASCDLPEIRRKKKSGACRKKSLSDREKAIKYINSLSPTERVSFLESFIEETSLKDIANNLHSLIIAKSRIIQTIKCCEKMLRENAQAILDPSLCDNAVYYLNTELLNHFGDKND
tara:strand:+ start:312 stop:1079 length:768 start_codon:yes stop_codon:yes gene_type:complete